MWSLLHFYCFYCWSKDPEDIQEIFQEAAALGPCPCHAPKATQKHFWPYSHRQHHLHFLRYLSHSHPPTALRAMSLGAPCWLNPFSESFWQKPTIAIHEYVATILRRLHGAPQGRARHDGPWASELFCRFWWGFGIFFFSFPWIGTKMNKVFHIEDAYSVSPSKRSWEACFSFMSLMFVRFFSFQVGSCWGRYQVRGAAAQLVSASKRWPNDTKPSVEGPHLGDWGSCKSWLNI